MKRRGRPPLPPEQRKPRAKRVQVCLSEKLEGWTGKEVKLAAEWAVDKGYKVKGSFLFEVGDLVTVISVVGVKFEIEIESRYVSKKDEHPARPHKRYVGTDDRGKEWDLAEIELECFVPMFDNKQTKG